MFFFVGKGNECLWNLRNLWRTGLMVPAMLWRVLGRHELKEILIPLSDEKVENLPRRDITSDHTRHLSTCGLIDHSYAP